MEYRNPCATADIIIERNNQVLLIRRKHEPFRNMWAIPGGFINCDKETLEQTAQRELKEETGLIVKAEDLELLGVYSSPDRDPRGHVIAHVYVTRKWQGKPKPGDDAEDARFFPLANLPELAFDHREIIVHYQELKGGSR